MAGGLYPNDFIFDTRSGLGLVRSISAPAPGFSGGTSDVFDKTTISLSPRVNFVGELVNFISSSAYDIPQVVNFSATLQNFATVIPIDSGTLSSTVNFTADIVNLLVGVSSEDTFTQSVQLTVGLDNYVQVGLKTFNTTLCASGFPLQISLYDNLPFGTVIFIPEIQQCTAIGAEAIYNENAPIVSTYTITAGCDDVQCPVIVSSELTAELSNFEVLYPILDETNAPITDENALNLESN